MVHIKMEILKDELQTVKTGLELCERIEWSVVLDRALHAVPSLKPTTTSRRLQ